MNNQLLKLIVVFLFVTVCANAQEKKIPAAKSSKAKLVTVYDGKVPLNIFLMDGYLAEIGIASEKNSKVKSLDSSAKAVHNLGFAQVFRVADPNLINGGKISAKASNAGKFSAVYSRTGDESSFIIPTGFIVTYKTGVNEKQIAETEIKYALKKGNKLIENMNLYSYEVEAGQPCLELASTIRSESIVETTSVDFIEERATR